MRVYQVLMLTGLVSIVLLGMLLSAAIITTPKITAEVNIVPEVFNLKRINATMGVITARISNLTKDDISYDVSDINVSTIVLYYEGAFIAEAIPEAIRATVANDILIVKFDATQVADYIWTIVYHMGNIQPPPDYPLELTVSGQLKNGGEEFAGKDTIQVILP